MKVFLGKLFTGSFYLMSQYSSKTERGKFAFVKGCRQFKLYHPNNC